MEPTPSTSSASTVSTTSGPTISSWTSAPTWALSASGPPRRSRHVLAVEPILTEALRENVARNGGGVDVVDGGALGTGGESARIAWGGEKTLAVTTRTLGEFAAMAGGCDFLKCDCEGGRNGSSGHRTSMGGCAGSRWNSICRRSEGR
ncbi:hypothetical protein [Methanoculleus chikugoensis]|uniref:hypothetical protein n=1 Tax=Methanoculleus chikugoensis TaxID=118126 RepID=UPI000A8C4CAE|nr:hypothetical protein [Methanoculleus chikugoensis]